jgi:hypothetical protein
MPAVSAGYRTAWLSSIQEAGQAEWDRLAQETPTPFLHWQWLHLLERSRSVSLQAGWRPRHLAVYKSGRLVGAAPLYIKDQSSEGEFVFDHPWVQLADKLNVPYFPKIVGMSPFTPIGAYSFLLDPGQDRREVTALMQEEIDRLCLDSGIGGSHYNFVVPGWEREMQEQGFIPWIHPGFVWTNPGYAGFDDFLARLKSSRRKTIKRERSSLAKQGIRIEIRCGQDIQEQHLRWMYSFYARTNLRYFPWSCKYLTEDFFSGLARDCTSHLVLMIAYARDQRDPVGMSMLVRKGKQLFGRYWGGQTDIPFLHFNLCYYQPIEWAVQQGIERFDPGMGGEHKLYRGFELVPNYSLHKMYSPQMQDIMAMSLQEFNVFQNQRILELNRELPLKKASKDNH